jgi:PAS domain S-box-containing protein
MAWLASGGAVHYIPAMPGAHENLLESIGLSPMASVISNPRRPDNPLEAVNSAFTELTGYAEREIIGRNCRFLAGEGTEPWITERIREAVRSKKAVLVNILNYRSDGTPFRNGVLVSPLFDEEGELAWFLGSQVELAQDSDPQFEARRARAVALVKQLPPRRRQVLQLMGRGLLNKQIAWNLKISEKTVKMHRTLLLDQLGVGTTADAIRIAVEAGL